MSGEKKPGDGKQALYVGLTLKGWVHPDDWRRVLQAVDVAASGAAPEMKLTTLAAYLGDEKVMEFRR